MGEVTEEKGTHQALQLEEKENPISERISFENNQLAQALFGEHNQHVRLIEQRLGLRISTKGNTLQIRGEGPEVFQARRLFQELYGLVKKGHPLYDHDIEFAIRFLRENPEAGLQEVFLDAVYVTSKKRLITPKTLNQRDISTP
jgi:phosphate starvation-inducible PhoH-like protein